MAHRKERKTFSTPRMKRLLFGIVLAALVFPGAMGGPPGLLKPKGVPWLAGTSHVFWTIPSAWAEVPEPAGCFALTGRAKTGKVQLVWSAQEGATGYEVYRSHESSAFDFQKIGQTPSETLTYLDTSVTNDTTYLYSVCALSGTGRCCSDVWAIRPPSTRQPGANASPVIYSQPVMSGLAGAPYTYDVEATDPNPGDVLTFSLDAAPAGMTISAATGLIQWTPTSTQTGSHAVTVRVTDSGGLFDTQTFTIQVAAANQAPTITSSPVTSATVGQPYTYDVEATDPNPGDVLTFSLDAAPAGMTISATTGLIQWTPTSTQTGSHSVTVRVTDSGGLFDTQTYTVTVSAGGVGPASMSLDLQQTVVNAGKSIPFVVRFYDNAGNPLDPQPSPTCTVSYDTAAVMGTVPSLVPGQIQTYTDTRGVYRLNCASPTGGLSEAMDFVVIASTVGTVKHQQKLYDGLSASLSDAERTVSAITQALGEGNLAALPALRDQLVASKNAVNLIALRRSTPFAPEGGFPPTPEELTAAGFPPNADDAVLGTLAESVVNKVQEIISFVRSINPLALNDTVGAQLLSLNTQLQNLITQLEALNPTVNGITAHSGRLNALLADVLPTYLHTAVDKIHESLKANGLVTRNLLPSDDTRLAMGYGSTAPTPAQYYANVQPVFFGLIDLMGSMSLQVQLVKMLYGEVFKYLENAMITLIANDLLKAFLNNMTLEGIITGASLSFHYFNMPGSSIEGNVVNPIASRNDVFLVGPNAVDAVRDLLTSLNPSEIEDIDDVWDYFEGIAEAIKKAGEAFEEAYQVPDDVLYGCVLSPDPSCRTAYYDDGFQSVYECSGWFCPPAPVLVLVHNLDKGTWAWGLFNFFPD